MKVIKYYRNPATPEFARLLRVMDNPGHMLHRHMLVEGPLNKRYEVRHPRWLPLDSVYVDWIREFKE